ncbi:MAG: hypothetical protein Q9227_004109 [Pyrenula ochraceoflavens]
MKTRRLASTVALISLVGISILLLWGPTDPLLNNAEFDEPPPLTPAVSHPIAQLVEVSQREFEDLRKRQSQSLVDAIEAYKKRYQISPPPNFDKWFAFAKRRGVQLKDEYDTIYNSILPFWAIDPYVLRERVRESLGFENGMIVVTIRGGSIIKIDGGGDGYQWQREATEDMLKGFVQYLPDMDLAFNVHDEPRIVLPSDDLSRLVDQAKEHMATLGNASGGLKNSWSKSPPDMGDGTRIKEYRTTRFNEFAHQPTWSNSRMSCPVDTAARSLNETAEDDVRLYAIEPLGFISNTTSFSDICNSPSLQRTFGFFDRPNAFRVAHDLFPVFSQSKMSSFQDILYPSPWYWADRARYDPEKDVKWDEKEGRMFWRGSTTGGFSRDGGWRRQHRQRFLQKINKLDRAKILARAHEARDSDWIQTEVPRPDMKDLFDVHFTFIGQCDPGDCDAQREYFEVVNAVDMYDAFKYKYLLDIDGNAFSGRYYAFLLSHSLVYKLALFREWHDEILKPWVHYVPLSLHGEEYVESVRYFEREEEGRAQAKKMADSSRDWAEKALRKVDMEAWFFRLLLEYGRVIDDNRDSIGVTA